MRRHSWRQAGQVLNSDPFDHVAAGVVVEVAGVGEWNKYDPFEGVGGGGGVAVKRQYRSAAPEEK